MTSSIHKAFLCCISERKLFRVIASLLYVGAEPNARDESGNTPLHLAVLMELPRISQLLLCLGADPTLENEESQTALMLGLQCKCSEVAETFRNYLQDKDANKDYISYTYRGCFDSRSESVHSSWKVSSSFEHCCRHNSASIKCQSSDSETFYSCESEIRDDGLPNIAFCSSEVETPEYTSIERSCLSENVNDLSDLNNGIITESNSVYESAFSLIDSTSLCWNVSSHDNLSTTEYLYTDIQENVSFLEQRLPFLTPEDSVTSVATSVLVKELKAFGRPPGPIDGLTKPLYVKQYLKFKENPSLALSNKKKEYSAEIQKTLNDPSRLKRDQDKYRLLEQQMVTSFENCFLSKNVGKTCFTYLLLDPRYTKNLPLRAVVDGLSFEELWHCFVESIFYVGKGSRARPYAHLYEAKKVAASQSQRKESEKIKKIRDIWDSSYGVVSLHVFQNVTPAEAFTREAVMIDAMGIKALTNAKKGEYYGVIGNWRHSQRRDLGVWLLHQALLVFLAEGERHIKPVDLV
ncbi:ankyrin repeat and LEM domain-containing protein 1-like [Artemia franciscana]|uniref:ankyrin repeat and LEM domain-containing protein 1-like n=1 Tax=Artemia franciscana TaxID=6661 RepID=UPI0032DA6E6D